MQFSLHCKSLLWLAAVSAGVLALPSLVHADSIALTSSSTYTQNFDSLAATGSSTTVPTGWAYAESGTAADGSYATGTGSSTTGNTYSFGSNGSTDRAFGGLRSGTLIPVIGASFTNSLGTTLSNLSISYTGEQWRYGGSAQKDQLVFSYSTDATSLTTGMWTTVSALTFTAPDVGASVNASGAVDGNNAANRALISSTISGLSVADGSTIWIRWTDLDVTGSDDGLAVDDFSASAKATPLPMAASMGALGLVAVPLVVKLRKKTRV